MTTAFIAALALANPQNQTVEVPFKIADNAIIVESVINGRKVACMFDTGFSGYYKLNATVNLGRPTGSITLRDFVGEFQAPTVRLTSMKMGPLDLKVNDEATAVVHGNNNYSMVYGTHVDGIMGLAPIAHTVFTIDFERSRFVFHPKSFDITRLPVDGQRNHRLRMLPKGNNSIELSVEAHNGNKMTLALDTGNAFYATTHKDVLERIGLWKPGTKPNFMRQAWVASGAVDSWYAKLRNVKIYGIPVEESVWSIIDLPSSSADGDGTVGFGFLRNFNITVDMERRLVHLANFSGRVSDPPLGDIGLAATYRPEMQRMWIFNVTPGGPADRAGIKRGDHLLGIDGEFVRNMDFESLRRALEGEPGSTVNLSVSRNGELIRHELKRETMVNPTLTN